MSVSSVLSETLDSEKEVTSVNVRTIGGGCTRDSMLHRFNISTVELCIFSEQARKVGMVLHMQVYLITRIIIFMPTNMYVEIRQLRSHWPSDGKRGMAWAPVCSTMIFSVYNITILHGTIGSCRRPWTLKRSKTMLLIHACTRKWRSSIDVMSLRACVHSHVVRQPRYSAKVHQHAPLLPSNRTTVATPACPLSSFPPFLFLTTKVGSNLNYDEVVVYKEEAALPMYLIVYTL